MNHLQNISDAAVSFSSLLLKLAEKLFNRKIVLQPKKEIIFPKIKKKYFAKGFKVKQQFFLLIFLAPNSQSHKILN